MTQNEATRRRLLQGAAVLGPIAAVTAYGLAKSGPAHRDSLVAEKVSNVSPLKPPASGKIPVAFPISKDAVLIDFVGPWEVFLNASVIGAGGAMDMAAKDGFHLYTVAETRDPIEAGGHMKIVPDYTFADAPQPKVIVIPAQSGDADAMIHWIREASKQADLTMSVCTGAFTLAKTGLLSGKAATTHHGAYSELAMMYPDIRVKRGYRFVDLGDIASSGGLTCGVDLAFHVVERYFGRKRALGTALQMEYQGRGWMDATGADNVAYAKASTGLDCPVCGMTVDAKMSPTTAYKGKTYYFCTAEHKAIFDNAPNRVLQSMT